MSLTGSVKDSDIESLESDPIAIERIAREELGLARPGEVLVFLDAERRTMVALGDPREMRESCEDEKVRQFLQRGKVEGPTR